MGETQSLTVDAERQRQLIDSFTVYCSTLSPEERDLLNDPVRKARIIERCILPRDKKDILYSSEPTFISQSAISYDIEDERKIIKITTQETLSPESFSQLFVDNPQVKVVLISETYSQRIETEEAKKIRGEHPDVLFVINTRRGKQEAPTYNTPPIDETMTIPREVFLEYEIDSDGITIMLKDIIDTLRTRNGHYIDYLTFELAYRAKTPDDILNILGVDESERYRFFAFTKRNVEFSEEEDIETLQFQPIDPHIIRKALIYWMERQEQSTIHNINLHTVIRVINGIAAMFLIPDIPKPANYNGIDYRIDKFVNAIINDTINRKATQSLESKQPAKGLKGGKQVKI